MNVKDEVKNIEELVKEITNLHKEIIGFDEEIKRLNVELEYLHDKRKAVLIQIKRYIGQLEKENHDNESVLNYISTIYENIKNTN